MIWVTFVLFTMKISFLAIHIQDIKPDKLVQRGNFPSTGVQPALNEYHFLPLHFYIIFQMYFYVLIKWLNNALARNDTQRELVASQYNGVYSKKILFLNQGIYENWGS